MNREEYIPFFRFAVEYLKNTPQVLQYNIDINLYREPNGFENGIANITEIFKKAIISAFNSNRRSNWAISHFGGRNITQAINNLDNAFGLNPAVIQNDLLNNEDNCIDIIRTRLLHQFPNLNDTPTYLNTLCKMICCGSKFFNSYRNEQDFLNWCQSFRDIEKPHLLKALPLEISMKVPGLGFATACDFIKELPGFEEFIKPDVHIKNIFTTLGIESLPCLKGAYEDIAVFDTVVNFAIQIQETGYWVDKVIWLICTRNFYRNPNVPKPIQRNAPVRRQHFIRTVNQAREYNYSFAEWRLHNPDEGIPN